MHSRAWKRVLGRLQRINITSPIMRRASKERSPAEEHRTSPTDPEVYNSRSPTPIDPVENNCGKHCNHYARPINIRYLNEQPKAPTTSRATETVTSQVVRKAIEELNNDVLEEVLENIEEAFGDDIELDEALKECQSPTRPDSRQGNAEIPSYDYVRPSYVATPAVSSTTESPTGYVTMHPSSSQGLGTTPKQRRPQPLPESAARPTSARSLLAEPSTSPRETSRSPDLRRAYENTQPRMIGHTPYELPHAIPQGSPPNVSSNRQVPLQYREYADPRIAPAYSFICHSAWYIQLDEDYVICETCATSEHLFCVPDRRIIMWKHLHFISRNFYHTTLHCGRCYKLLFQTRRAIECAYCRSYIMNHYTNIERVIYHVLCDLSLPYN